MKRPLILSFFILSTLLVFTINSFAQPSVIASTTIQKGANTLQEADKLFVQAMQASDNTLMRQAKDKLTLWLENNKKADNKLIAQALRTRASAAMVIDEPKAAMSDYKESILYEPVGEVQLGICLLDKKQNNLSDLPNCYAKAVKMFTDKQTPNTNANYLIARILSGDNSAINEYKHIVQTTTGDTQLTYKMAAQAYLDESIYNQIIEQ